MSRTRGRMPATRPAGGSQETTAVLLESAGAILLRTRTAAARQQTSTLSIPWSHSSRGKWCTSWFCRRNTYFWTASLMGLRIPTELSAIQRLLRKPLRCSFCLFDRNHGKAVCLVTRPAARTLPNLAVADGRAAGKWTTAAALDGPV